MKKVLAEREATLYAIEQVKSTTPRFDVISQLNQQQKLLEEQLEKLQQQSRLHDAHAKKLEHEIESRQRGSFRHMPSHHIALDDTELIRDLEEAKARRKGLRLNFMEKYVSFTSALLPNKFREKLVEEAQEECYQAQRQQKLLSFQFNFQKNLKVIQEQTSQSYQQEKTLTVDNMKQEVHSHSLLALTPSFRCPNSNSHYFN